MRLAILTVAAAFTALATAPARAEPLVLNPSTTWTLDYAEDKCRLIRKFGSGETEVELHIEQSGTGPFYNLALFGKPARKDVGDVMRIAFGPNEGPSERSYLGGRIKSSKTPFVMMHGIHLAPVARNADQGEFEVTEIGPDRERAITSLTLTKGLRRPLQLQIESMEAPLNAMRACVADLIQTLKLDENGLAQIVTPPEPKNAMEFARFMQERYPPQQIRNEQGGTVAVQLTINDKGEATACQIAASDRPAVFDDAVCFGLMRMAEFEPAVGPDGKPRFSFWRTRVTYRMN
ncbi:TonB family protein [Erythrobacter sp. NFXS35]|uniref:TonB family protein n=1 Tax=Erythrobacter sp. NFXS35 TaxID=2818436 RepID=UPI0032E04A8F